MSEGEGGNANSSSAMEDSSSQCKSLKTTAIVHDSNPQVSSPTYQERTVIHMETDEADKQQDWGRLRVQVRARGVA